MIVYEIMRLPLAGLRPGSAYYMLAGTIRYTRCNEDTFVRHRGQVVARELLVENYLIFERKVNFVAGAAL